MADTISILCVENEAVHIDRVEMLVEKLGYHFAGAATNAADALDLFYTQQPDLILMDIRLDGTLDGIQLAELVVKKHPTPLIFVTAFDDDTTFQRARQVQPFAYIIKPFDEKQLARTIELAVAKLSKEPEKSDFEAGVHTPDKLFFKINNKLKRVKLSSMIYLEADGRYSAIVTEEGRKYLLRVSLTNLLKQLPDDKFLRIHRSYGVQVEKIKEVDLLEQMVHLENQTLPFSRRQKNVILERLSWLS